MTIWQEQYERLANYVRPWQYICVGFGFIFETRPTWLGGSGKPENLSRQEYATGRLYQTLGPGMKQFEGSSTAVPSLVASAKGVILEVGPGLGSQLSRYDQAKIQHVYGVEPNPMFVAPLLAEIDKVGLQGRYTLIHGRIEDGELLGEHGVTEGSIDSIVCMQALCSVAHPESVTRELYRLLKPGGTFIFWEHRSSHDRVTRLVQAFWNPVWTYFMGGCSLNRPLGEIILTSGAWNLELSSFKDQTTTVAEWTCLPRFEGTLVKSI